MESKRLRFREYTLKDQDWLYRILSDPVTMAFYPEPYDEKGTLRWIRWNLDNYEKYGFGLWALELKENGEMIRNVFFKTRMKEFYRYWHRDKRCAKCETGIAGDDLSIELNR